MMNTTDACPRQNAAAPLYMPERQPTLVQNLPDALRRMFQAKNASDTIDAEPPSMYVVLGSANAPVGPPKVWVVRAFAERYDAVDYASRCRFEVSKIMDVVLEGGRREVKGQGHPLDPQFSSVYEGTRYRVLEVPAIRGLSNDRYVPTADGVDLQ